MSRIATIHYVGFGGADAEVTGECIHLGRGVRRKHEVSWLFHFCFGYVSGFPIRAIAYYLLTRHTTSRMAHWAWIRERPAFERETGQSWPRCGGDNCRRCGRHAVTNS